MKNKGFTLIELLASIIIIGIISLVGINAISSVLGTAKTRYYNTLVEEIRLAGKDYFSDSSNKLPKTVGHKSTLDAKTLIDNKYISKIVSYSKNKCYLNTTDAKAKYGAAKSDQYTKVVAVKTKANKYTYVVSVYCEDYTYSEAMPNVTEKPAPAPSATTIPAVENKYRVSATVAAGSGTISGTGNYDKGSAAVLIAQPAAGYAFAGWKENGVKVTTNYFTNDETGASYYTIPNISGDHLTITASFAKKLINHAIYNFKAASNTAYAFDIKGGVPTEDAHLQLYGYNNTAAQKFIAFDNGDGTWSFVVYSSGLYLDLYNSLAKNDNYLQQHHGNDTIAQKWYIKYNENDSVTFLSAVDKNYAIDNLSGIPSNGVIHLWTANDTIAQQFKAVQQGTFTPMVAINEKYTIKSALGNNMCLDIASGSTDPGANLQIYNCNGTKAQQFIFKYGPYASYIIYTNTTFGTDEGNRVLDVQGGTAGARINIQQYYLNYSIAQNWYVLNYGSQVALQTRDNGNIVMDVDAGQAQNLQNVQCYTSNGTLAQRWILVKN